MVLLQVGQVCNLVAPEVVDNIGIRQKILDLGALLLVLLPLRQHLLALLDVFLRPLVQVVQLCEKVSNEVRHVGLLEKLELELSELRRWLLIFIACVFQKLNQRENEMPVEVGDELWQNAVLLRDVLWRLRLVCGIAKHFARCGRLLGSHVCSVDCSNVVAGMVGCLWTFSRGGISKKDLPRFPRDGVARQSQAEETLNDGELRKHDPTAIHARSTLQLEQSWRSISQFSLSCAPLARLGRLP